MRRGADAVPPFPPPPMHPVEGCPVEAGLRLLTGKWRLMTLFHLLPGPRRFNALRAGLAPVTQKVLTATLRGLEADGLVWRRVEPGSPPRVTYGLSERATALSPIFTALAAWAVAEGLASAPPQSSPLPTCENDIGPPMLAGRPVRRSRNDQAGVVSEG